MEGIKKKEVQRVARGVTFSKYLGVFLLVSVPLVYAVWFFYINQLSISNDPKDWGVFASFFGGILSPVIAFLAFYWLTQSVVIQKHELSAAHEVLAETEKAQREQAITQEKKRFEDTFHSLLAQMNAVFQYLGKEKSIGIGTDSSLIGDYHHAIIISHRSELDIDDIKRKIKRTEVCRRCNHYFLIIYQILKFILMNSQNINRIDFDTAISQELSDIEKIHSDIVKAFLSYEVTQILAVYCISHDDELNFEFKVLVERYSILENIHVDNDCVRMIIDHYKSVAFGCNDFKVLELR